MRLFGYLILAILMIGAAQYVAIILCLSLLLLLVWGALARPRETFGLLGLGILGTLVERYPLFFLGFLVVIVIADVIYKRERSTQKTVELIPPPST